MARDVLDEHRLRRLIDVGRGLVAQLDLDAVLNEVVEVARELTGARHAAFGILGEDPGDLERYRHVGTDAEMRAQIAELSRGRGGVLEVPIVVRGRAYGNLHLAEKADGAFDVADEEAATILAEWAAVAIFNIRLYSQSEEERRALERAMHGLEATAEIARAVGGETDRARVLETIAKRARTLVGAHSLLVLLRDGARSEVVAAAGECGTAPVGRYVTVEGVAAEEGLAAARGIGIDARAALFSPPRLSRQGAGCDRRSGSARGRPPRFHPEDERLLVAAATSAAAAVATVQSVTEERLRQSLMAAERERARWARELHDTVLQGMGARRLLLTSVLKSGDPEGLKSAVEEGLRDVGRDIDELRRLITELRPATLDQLGLFAALEDLVERVRHSAGVELETDLRIDAESLDPSSKRLSIGSCRRP